MISVLKKISPGIWIVALIAAIHAIRILSHLGDAQLGSGQLVGPADPDPWLRLTVLRDWLMGGSWYSHVVTNSNAPFGGISTPWTRPLDVILAVLTYLQPSSAPLNERLIHAAMIMPWLMMLALMCGIVFATRQLTRAPIAPVFSVSFLATMPLMWNYFEHGYADHHSLLAVLLVWAVALLLSDAPSKKQLCISGILLGLMLWVSPEALMPLGIIYLGFGLRWLGGDARALRQLLPLATCAALTATAAVMIERAPGAWFHPIYDSISIVHAYALQITALGVALLSRFTLGRLGSRALLGGIVAATLVALLWAAFPVALKGPMAEVEPYILSTFLPNISEATSVFEEPLMLALALMCHPMLALVLCAIAWRRGDTLLRPSAALKLGYLCFTLSLLFLTQVRWSYYFYPVVALAIAPFLAGLFKPEEVSWRNLWPAHWLAGDTPTQQMKKRMPLLTLAYLAPLLLALGTPNNNSPTRKSFDACSKQVRIAISNGSLLAALGQKPLTIFTHTNWGANLLFFTPYKIVASNYHREGKGIEYLWEAEKITDLSALRRHFAERKIQVLLQCPVDRAKQNALQDIYTGKTTPAWLKSVPLITTGDAADAPKLFLVH